MPKTVLVVDDEPALRMLQRRWIEIMKLDIEVTEAGGELEARARLREQRFDILVTDLEMSGQDSEDGFKLAGVVKEAWPNTRMVLLTGRSQVSLVDILRWREKYGFEVVLLKPLTKEPYQEVIVNLLMPPSTNPA